MAVQELKTQLVFEASNAIKSMSVLYETLNKVAHVDFKQLSNGFREMAKVIEFAQTQAGDSIRRAVIEGSQKAVDAQKKAIEQLKRNAEQQMKDLAELEKNTLQRLKENTARELQKIADAQKKATAEEKAKLKAQEDEIKNLQKLTLLTMQLREQENKAIGGLNKKIFQQSDFDAVERRLTSVAQKIERIQKDANITIHIGAFVDFLKGINTKNYEAVAKKAAEEQARKAYEARGTALIKAHGQQMNKMMGDLTVGKTDELKKDQQILSSITREIARIYVELGKANTAAGYFKQALNLANNRKEFKAMLEDIAAFRQQQNIKDRAWNAAGLDSRIKAYQAMRQEMQSDPFIATASATKLDRYKREMAELAASIARIYKETGEAAKGVKYLEDAFRTVEGHKGLQKRYADELAALKTFVIQQELALKRVNEGVWGSPEWKAKQVEKQRFLAAQARQRALKSAAEKKEEEERVKRYERLARLAGRIAEIQSKINGRFSIGKPFTENEFAKIRNQLHNIGLEMDKISGKNVSGYLAYILDGVRVKNTPSTNATAQRLSDQYNDVRKKAEDAAAQFAKTKSIADAIRLQGAMKDLQAVTKETETVNRLLGKTEGMFERITNLLTRRLEWHMGEDFVRQLLDLPQVFFQNYRDIEQTMAGVQQVMPLVEGKSAEIFAETSRLFDVAESYARTVQEVVEGATLWGRGYGKPSNDADEIRQSLEETNQALAAQGLGVKAVTDAEVNYINKAEAMATTNELVRQSAMLATVDNFSMAESVRGLEAVLASYGLRAKTAAEATLYAGRAVDIITKVAHYGQISAQDLVRGIEATGKAAEQAGISLEFLTALLETGVRNTAKSGSDIGNAIKALTVGIYGDKGQEKLNEFGIATTFIDESGLKHARSAQAIILDIARALNEGNKNAQKMLLAISGGRYQYSKISAILKDETEILKMWSEAVNSSGFSERQLEVQMNTINAKMKQLESSAQELGNAFMKESGIGELIKSSIEKITEAVKELKSNLNAVIEGGKTFLGIFAIGKILSFGGALISTIQKIAEFRKQLAASGYTGGLMGVFKRGVQGIFDPTMNGKQKSISVNQALTASENQLTAAQRQQIAVQSQALMQSFQIMGIRMRQIGVNGIFQAAMRAKTAGVVADTAALGANAVAARAAAGAALPLAGAMAVATGGFSLLTALLTFGIPLFITWANATDTVSESVDKLTDKTEKFISEKEEESNAIAQDIMRRRQNVEIMETAIKQYMSATKALKKATESSEEYEKAVERQKTAEKILAQALSDEIGELNTAAVERIKAADDTRAAFEKEKEAYLKGTKEKKDALEKARQAEKAALDERLQTVAKMKVAYDADIKNFGNWKDEREEILENHLGFLGRWALRVYRVLDYGDKARELDAQKYGDMYVSSYYNKYSKGYRQEFKDALRNSVLASMGEMKKQLEDEEKQLKARKAALAATDFVDNPYENTNVEDETLVDAGSEKSKKKKPKYVEQYDTVMMRYLGAVAKQSKKLSVADLVAMGGYIKGGSGLLYNPLDMSDVNPFGVTQALMQQFNPDGSIANVEDNARAFNEAVIAFNGSAEEFLEWWFLQIGRAKDAADAALLRAQTVNQAEYLENGNDAFGGIDYKKRANTFAIHKSMSDALKSHVVTSYDGNSIAGLYSWAKEESGYLMPDEVFDYIVEIAKQRNYAPDMLKTALAVAIQESKGVQASVSDAGALGVFQLMPETAADLGVDPYDWRQNIQGGMTYLEQQAREFDGDLRKTLAAYNAGAGNVYHYGGVPPTVEAQNYVKEIEERLSHIADYEEKPHPSSVDDTGEGTYWVRQHGGVSLEGAQPETVAAIRAAGQWFKQRTGHPLVITAVTNGNHAPGEFSHGTGWKFDANDYGSGAEGSLTTADFKRGYLMDEFVKYLQWLGLGANIENEGNENIHLDIDVKGRQWAGELAGTNFGGFNKARAGLAKTSKEQNLPYVLEEGGLNSYWSAQNKQFKAPYLSFDKLPQLQKEWSEKQHAYETQLTAMQTRQKNADNLLTLYKSVYEKKTGQSYDTAREEQNQLLRLQNQYLLEQNFVEQIKEKQDFISEWRQNVKDYVDDFLQSHKQIATLLSQKGVAWDDLTGEQQLSIAKRFGGDDNEELEEMIKNSEQLRQEWHSVNQLLDAHKQRLIDIRYQMANIGNTPVISPEDAENADLKHFELDYKNATTGAVYENQDRLRQYKLERIDLLQRRKVRLEGEKRIADDDADRRKQTLLERLESEKDVRKVLQQRQDAGEDVSIELQTQEMLIERLNADYQTLNLHGTQEQINYQLRIKETTNEIKELEKSLYPIENQLWQSLSDGVMNMFDSILLKGNSFKDAWNNLWQSIASMALRQLLMVQLKAWSVKFDWGLFGDGGEIPKKKNGGYIPSFASGGVLKKYSAGSKIDAGIIKGAGTATSDSILTYLENRGQFIRTSDGEFIIKKKSVDTLGLSFLNRLNENPEQIAFKEKVLNAYAGGGSLGEEMTPVMSDKTVENLQLFTKNQTEKENRNVRQEKLLEGISAQLSAFTQPVNETTNMNINAVDSRSFVQLLEKHSDVLMGLMRKERGRRNSY